MFAHYLCKAKGGYIVVTSILLLLKAQYLLTYTIFGIGNISEKNIFSIELIDESNSFEPIVLRLALLYYSQLITTCHVYVKCLARFA
jgi:hypothetical protein